ncbi:isopentenyl phosphate kinase family protein [Haloterrigena sp. SYSU A558-1]|uniref:Isopentenyl phosphate kinase n=1 Tax=Haloterrigena gelatinilytica TaxID=2741724 RepID=A0ABX2L8R5_9EURY|nr:isopentenyl phosphate kinase [Haloterrigena gelatinilytica]NUC71288.1 isopentenyl phosphate kinase family protein [Haloterrigena gelatinilytica]
MIVLKLGGSVITDKDRPETLDGEALERAADAVAAALEGGVEDLVIVHGGGSFGHHNASEHGVTTAEGTRDAGAALDIHGAMTTLNRFVLSRLLERGVEAVPVHPFSAGHRDVEGDLELPTGQVATLLAEGFVPVLHGDLVAHAGAGATVVSGDELVTALARDLEADRIGLCSTVPGVLDDDDAVIDRIAAYEDVAGVLGESAATDVTGGMAAKVQALLTLEAEASIFGLEDLEAFLAGDEPGTTIDSS